MRKLMVGVAFATGCTGGNGNGFQGENMLDYLPFDRNLDCEWEYQSTDISLSYKLRGTIDNVEQVGDLTQYTVLFEKDCVADDATCVEGEFVHSMTWSIQGNQGAHIHAAQSATGTLTLDPSIRFVERFMRRDESVETDVNGVMYTSKLVEFGECPVAIPEWTDCARMELTSSAADDEVTGTYWMINDFNIVAMEWPDQSGRWELNTHRTLE